MDEHRQQALLETHDARRRGVEDLVDHLDLDEVVAGSEGADLGPPTIARPPTDGREVGAVEKPALLGSRDVRLRPPAAASGPLATLAAGALKLAVFEPHRAAGADTARAGRVERGGEVRHVLLHIGEAHIGREQADAAVDVVADGARRDHAARQLGGGDAADRESVPLVDVGHDQNVTDHPGERRRVDRLLE